MTGFLIAVAASVAAGLVLIIAGVYLPEFIKKHYLCRPKIRITTRNKSSGTFGGPGRGVVAHWDGDINLDNITGFVAMDVELLEPHALPLKSSAQVGHIKGSENKTVEYRIERDAPEDIPKDRRKIDLFPEEYRSYRLIARYRNDKGKVFYTLFSREEGKEESTYHRRQPKPEK